MKVALIYIPRVTRTLFILDVLFIASVTTSLLYTSPEFAGLYTAGLSLTDLMATGMLIALITMIVLTANFAMGLYQRRYMRGRKLVVSTGICATLVLVALLFMDNLFLGNLFPFWQIASAELLTYGLILVSRPIVCNIFEHFIPKKRLALIGSDEMADRLRFAIGSASPADAELVNHYNRGEPLDQAGVTSTLKTIADTTKVDEVFVEMASGDMAALQSDATPHTLSSTALFFDRYERFADIDLFDVSSTDRLITQGKSHFWAKRVIETCVALLVLVFFLPLVVLAMIAIKLEDGGSLFYRQIRVGKNAKPFSVLKFRSMVENAEKNGAQWASVGDKRVTRVGAFLRKSRIDELPQLLNVIKGDMALVGPRPERPEFVAELAQQIPNFEARHVVRPGLTGWAQISYPYGSSLEDARWKTRFDLYYINHWSIWFDIAIIIQTVRVVLLAEGSR